MIGFLRLFGYEEVCAACPEALRGTVVNAVTVDTTEESQQYGKADVQNDQTQDRSPGFGIAGCRHHCLEVQSNAVALCVDLLEEDSLPVVVPGQHKSLAEAASVPAELVGEAKKGDKPASQEDEEETDYVEAEALEPGSSVCGEEKVMASTATTTEPPPDEPPLFVEVSTQQEDWTEEPAGLVALLPTFKVAARNTGELGLILDVTDPVRPLVLDIAPETVLATWNSSCRRFMKSQVIQPLDALLTVNGESGNTADLVAKLAEMQPNGLARLTLRHPQTLNIVVTKSEVGLGLDLKPSEKAGLLVTRVDSSFKQDTLAKISVSDRIIAVNGQEDSAEKMLELIEAAEAVELKACVGYFLP
eukprot:gb/GFBE01008410.1/.p1 GENE.gb/GFBE01008410.1/~~gb/GFBE01008410.1/.p1  ORF type:complete len:360 (+),score=88.53 gb/GFBE01008410.1/:1-1080(+)